MMLKAVVLLMGMCSVAEGVDRYATYGCGRRSGEVRATRAAIACCNSRGCVSYTSKKVLFFTRKVCLSSSSSYTNAENVCRSLGRRLPTLAEVYRNRACGNDCSVNNKRIWVSDAPAPETPVPTPVPTPAPTPVPTPAPTEVTWKLHPRSFWGKATHEDEQYIYSSILTIICGGVEINSGHFQTHKEEADTGTISSAGDISTLSCKLRMNCLIVTPGLSRRKTYWCDFEATPSFTKSSEIVCHTGDSEHDFTAKITYDLFQNNVPTPIPTAADELRFELDMYEATPGAEAPGLVFATVVDGKWDWPLSNGQQCWNEPLGRHWHTTNSKTFKVFVGTVKEQCAEGRDSYNAASMRLCTFTTTQGEEGVWNDAECNSQSSVEAWRGTSRLRWRWFGKKPWLKWARYPTSRLNDVEEGVSSDGTPYLNMQSSDLELTWEAKVDRELVVGIRFDGVDLSSTDKLTEVKLELECDEDEVGTATAPTIALAFDLSANSAPWRDGPYPYVYNFPSNRTLTSAVDWHITETWSKNYRYTSPNLAPLLQQVTALPGWAPGNSVSIIIKKAPSGAAKAARVAKTDRDNNKGAVLIVVTDTTV